MKRIILGVSVLLMTLTACGNNTPEVQQTQQPKQSSQAQDKASDMWSKSEAADHYLAMVKQINTDAAQGRQVLQGSPQLSSVKALCTKMANDSYRMLSVAQDKHWPTFVRSALKRWAQAVATERVYYQECANGTSMLQVMSALNSAASHSASDESAIVRSLLGLPANG